MGAITKAIRWAAGEVWEKVNVVGTWRTLKAAGQKYGRRFLVAAVIWEIIEDVVFPVLSWWFGVPELIPIFLIFHFEVITWPIFFWAFRTYDRIRGREAWEPERPAMSSHWRSAVKVGVYLMAMTGWMWAFLHPVDGRTSIWSWACTSAWWRPSGSSMSESGTTPTSVSGTTTRCK